jgi:hypothetical protein
VFDVLVLGVTRGCLDTVGNTMGGLDVLIPVGVLGVLVLVGIPGVLILADVWCFNTGWCTSVLILLGTAGVLVLVGLSDTSEVPRCSLFLY